MTIIRISTGPIGRLISNKITSELQKDLNIADSYFDILKMAVKIKNGRILTNVNLEFDVSCKELKHLLKES